MYEPQSQSIKLEVECTQERVASELNDSFSTTIMNNYTSLDGNVTKNTFYPNYIIFQTILIILIWA